MTVLDIQVQPITVPTARCDSCNLRLALYHVYVDTDPYIVCESCKP